MYSLSSYFCPKAVVFGRRKRRAPLILPPTMSRVRYNIVARHHNGLIMKGRVIYVRNQSHIYLHCIKANMVLPYLESC